MYMKHSYITGRDTPVSADQILKDFAGQYPDHPEMALHNIEVGSHEQAQMGVYYVQEEM